MTAAAIALEGLVGQDRARELLLQAVRQDRLSHAYLFVGAPGSGTLDAALALAEAIVCPAGGDGTCEECALLHAGNHPDVHMLEPDGVSGYVVEQVRSIIEDVNLTPIRARRKVYVVDRADLLGGASANALLKTLEEPPQDVVFILIGTSVDGVLPTIASRCQVVPFSAIPADLLARRVAELCSVDAADAAVALSVTRTTARAREFLASDARRITRLLVLDAMRRLAESDMWDVLGMARDIQLFVLDAAGLLRYSKKADEKGAPAISLAELGAQRAISATRAELAKKSRLKKDALVESEMEQMIAARGMDDDFYTPAMLRRLKEQAGRRISARERSGMIEALGAAESLLRDCLLRLGGVAEPAVNHDALDVVESICDNSSTRGVLGALEAVSRAADDLNHNVSAQLALEVMLCSVKEALTWR